MTIWTRTVILIFKQFSKGSFVLNEAFSLNFDRPLSSNLLIYKYLFSLPSLLLRPSLHWPYNFHSSLKFSKNSYYNCIMNFIQNFYIFAIIEFEYIRLERYLDNSFFISKSKLYWSKSYTNISSFPGQFLNLANSCHSWRMTPI